MGFMTFRWRPLIGTMTILLMATACFQTTGDEAQGQQAALNWTATATHTDIPTSTSSPTAADLAVANNPSDTPTATPTETHTPTPTPTETFTPQVVAQAGDGFGEQLVTPTTDTYSLTATMIVASSTARAGIPLTQTAQAQLGSITATPIPNPTSAFATATQATTNFVTGADCVHEVRHGDTLFRLSMYYGLPVADIANRNGVVNQNVIIVGQKLTIPSCGTRGVVPPPTSVPTATVTPYEYTLSYDTNVGTGGADLGAAGITTTISCASQYTVQQYDTLFQISLRYGVSAEAIANANGIYNLGRINMGDVLCIPSQ